MLCLSQCQSDSALRRTYWSSGGTAGRNSRLPKLFLFEPFLLVSAGMDTLKYGETLCDT